MGERQADDETSSTWKLAFLSPECKHADALKGFSGKSHVSAILRLPVLINDCMNPEGKKKNDPGRESRDFIDHLSWQTVDEFEPIRRMIQN